MSSLAFRRFSLGVLVYNLAVVAWGAFVRATGSGAGCGSHWPTCNGDVVPHAPVIQTLIEYTHRVSSGVGFLLLVGLVVWAFRAHPAPHPVRSMAALSGVTFLTEALIGALLVLSQHVAKDQSLGRVVFMALHLMNTFLLLAALTLTALHARGAPRLRFRGAGLAGALLALGLVAVAVLGVSGAVNALGDTLFPARSLQEGLAQDFSATASVLLRLRVLHPVLAGATGLYLLGMAWMMNGLRPSSSVRRAVWVLTFAFVAQFIAGLVNLILLAPVAMQLLHLLLADGVWIALVALAASALGETQAALQPSSAQPNASTLVA